MFECINRLSKNNINSKYKSILAAAYSQTARLFVPVNALFQLYFLEDVLALKKNDPDTVNKLSDILQLKTKHVFYKLAFEGEYIKALKVILNDEKDIKEINKHLYISNLYDGKLPNVFDLITEDSLLLDDITQYHHINLSLIYLHHITTTRNFINICEDNDLDFRIYSNVISDLRIVLKMNDPVAEIREVFCMYLFKVWGGVVKQCSNLDAMNLHVKFLKIWNFLFPYLKPFLFINFEDQYIGLIEIIRRFANNEVVHEPKCNGLEWTPVMFKSFSTVIDIFTYRNIGDLKEEYVSIESNHPKDTDPVYRYISKTIMT